MSGYQKTTEFKNVTILLPAMDETYSLKETVDIIMADCRHEDLAEFIIIVCDKTAAETRRTAEELIEKYSNDVNISLHEQTLPFVGGAVREGIDLAKGSHVVMMSSDLETDPHVIKKFIKGAKKYPDRIITATRWKNGGGFENYNRVKLICNLIFEKSIGIFYGVGLSDLTYAYRIFPTALMQSIRWEELKHPFFLETALKPLRLKVKFVETPGHWAARTEGQSQNGFFDNFKYFKTAFHNRFLTEKEILKDRNDG
ncbi:MAG: glycosyltransferase family 2 protein [Lachnospiraceae bacterium]|nr:glycosyltransferase family 2 protein [Lachnospiraceae bacterium]